MFRAKPWATAVCLAASLLLVSGCWNRGHRIQAPTALSYIDLNQILLQGISVNVPASYLGDLTRSFSVSPALPAGLTLDPSTGAITGAPADLLPPGTYTITARNAGGETQSVLTIAVNPQAPCGLTFLEEGIKYIGQISQVLNSPSFTCGFPGTPVDTWTIEPALPVGLTLDPVTGVISGVPTEVIPPTEFVIIATNVTGLAARSITIEVETPAPCDLAFSNPNTVEPPTVPSIPNLPSSACGAVAIYEITPTLPAGMSIDPSTGVISGTPSVETPEILYTITASNIYGEDSTEVTLRIAPVFEFTADDTDAFYDLTTGVGSFETRLFVEEGDRNATFPTPIIGLSMAFEHDPSLMTPVAVFPGVDLVSGTSPEFFEPLIQADAVTVGIIPSLDLLNLLVADARKEVVRVVYETEPAGLSGNAEGMQSPIHWGNPNALPPVQNEVGLSGTYSVLPVLIDSTVTLTPSTGE